MRWKRRIALLLPALLLLATAPAYGAGVHSERWHWVNPLPQGNDLYDVATGNGLLVAVGAKGTLLTSTDGIKWTRRMTPARWMLRGVAFGNGRWVAIGGHDYTLLTSEDSYKWELRESPDRGALPKSITFGGGLFLLVTDWGLFTSPDGVSWTKRTVSFRGRLSDATYGNGRFVVVGTEAMLTSADGMEWSVATFDWQPKSISVTAGDGLFVATANSPGPDAESYYSILTSADGLTWERRRLANRQDDWGSEDGFWMGIAFQNGRYVAVGSRGRTIYSDNAADWTLGHANGPDLRGVAFGPKGYVAVGSAGAVLASPVGDRWLELSSGLHHHWNAVTYGEHGFVVAGQWGTIMHSADGLDWTEVKAPPGAGGLYGATYAAGQYVLVGYGGAVLTSEDGIAWSQAETPNRKLLNGVAFGAGRYVAVGDESTIIYSDDGKRWQAVTGLPADRPIRAVAFGEGRFVAVGQGMFISTDGKVWTEVEIQRAFYGITYGLGQFVALTTLKEFALSDTGEKWFLEFLLPGESTSNYELTAVGYGDGWFMALGSYESEWAVFPSRYGQLWGRERLPRYERPESMPRSIAYGGGRYVVVGNEGTIMATQTATEYPPCREIFSDLYVWDAACGAIRRLVERGAIGGYPDGSFRPDGPVTRAEFVKMLTVALNRPLDPGGALPWSDVEGHWAAEGGYLQAARQMDQSEGYMEPVITGFPDGTFRPNETIQRAQLAKMVAVASKRAGADYVWSPYYDVEQDDWFAKYVGMTYRDWITGPDADSPMWLGLMLGPKELVSRAEAAVIIDNLLQAVPEGAAPSGHRPGIR